VTRREVEEAKLCGVIMETGPRTAWKAVRWGYVSAVGVGVLLGIYLANWLEFGLSHAADL
jgi:hypothetical protein